MESDKTGGKECSGRPSKQATLCAVSLLTHFTFLERNIVDESADQRETKRRNTELVSTCKCKTL